MFLSGRCTALPTEQPTIIDIQFGVRNIKTNTIVGTSSTKHVAEELLQTFKNHFPQNHYELVLIKEASPNQ